MGHHECGHIPLHVYEQFLIPSDPLSPKVGMVTWNLNTKSVPAIVKDTPSSLSDNMTTDDLVYIPYMESIWDRHFLLAWFICMVISFMYRVEPALPTIGSIPLIAYKKAKNWARIPTRFVVLKMISS